jgi:BirA family transcriptional regulator, biotin operon repressor / biotin---[acetyl-CoA-carboxylase] ligase
VGRVRDNWRIMATTSASAAVADRAPLSAAALAAALTGPGRLWRDVTVRAETGSTNSDLLAAARAGAPEGTVLAAEVQTAGRGRLDRRWICPPRAALSFSVLLRPDGLPPAARGWIPLLAGVAVAAGLRAQAGLDARLKWPNDVLVGGAKISGILAEQAGDAIVLGTGINVTTRREELPVPHATSVVLAGAVPDREQLLVAVLGELETWYRRWVAAVAAGPAGPGGDPAGLRAEYLRLSATVGQQVRVSMPGGKLITGRAQDVDATGRLVVGTASGPVTVSAGDVVHVR